MLRAALFVLSSMALLAQTPGFRVATRLIQVNVIVTDRDGRPITGLTKADFKILDQGRAQKIVVFTEQDPSAAGPRAVGEARVFSNRSNQGVTVVLFDRLNTRFEDSAFARRRLESFLGSVRPEERIALYGLSSRLVILHDFTADPAALQRALARFKSAESMETSATTFKESNTGDKNFDAALNNLNQRVSDVYMQSRVALTAAALETIAAHLSGVTGRKNLVWVSSAFPVSVGYFQKRMDGAAPQKGSFEAEAERAARALSSANVAIYPVDPHGLTTLNGAFDASTSPYRILDENRPSPQFAPVAEPETMQNLAEATGGRVFANTNDIEGAVRRAVDDSMRTYTLGYYPDHDRWNGEFREIKVTAGRPGVELRSRRGYIAFPEQPSEPKKPLSLAEIIREPLAPSELGISIEAERLGDRHFKFHLRIDTSSMQMDEKQGRWNAALEVLWEQIGSEGENVTGHGQTLTFRLSPETYASLAREGLKIASTETVDLKATELRFAARDPVTGAVGSVYIPVRSLPER